jgi:hypothetical protein
MRRIGLLVTGVLLMVAASASAQDTSRGEVSGGWRYYHTRISDAMTTLQTSTPLNDYPEGWYADVALNVSPKFAIVGEAGGTYYNEETSRTLGSITDRESIDVKFHTFMGGIRVRAPQNRRIVPFGQVLFGGERGSSSYERVLTFSFSPSPSRSQSAADSSNLALALDGGATIAAGWIGVRSSVGYARFFGRADADAFRLSLGAAVRF